MRKKGAAITFLYTRLSHRFFVTHSTLCRGGGLCVGPVLLYFRMTSRARSMKSLLVNKLDHSCAGFMFDLWNSRQQLWHIAGPRVTIAAGSNTRSLGVLCKEVR